MRDGYVVTWRGREYDAAPDGDRARIYAPEPGEGFEEVRTLVGNHDAVPGALDHEYWSDAEPCSMHIEEVEAIWSAIDEADNWAPLHAKIAAVRRMGEALRARADP